MTRKGLTILALTVAAIAMVATAQQRTARSVKSDRRIVQNEIADTRNKINQNKAQTRKKLAELASLQTGIERQSRRIDRLTVSIDSLDAATLAISDSIAAMKADTDRLRRAVGANLRAARMRRKSINNMVYVFSSADFGTAMRRINCIEQLNRYQSRRIDGLRKRVAAEREQMNRMSAIRSQRANDKSSLDAERQTMQAQKARQEVVVNDLRREGSTLNSVLAEKQKRMRQLDRELDRIIAEEQRRREAEERRAEEQRRKEEQRRAEEKRREELRRKEEQRKADEQRRAEEKRRAQEAKNNKKQPEKTESQPAKQPEPETPKAPVATPVEKPEEPRKKAAAVAEGSADADRRLSGSFEANKGSLLFPVAGSYRVVGGFGRGQHREISNIEVNNSGIDIEVAPGTAVRSVFAGTVSSVFLMPGYNNIVIVRHGRYLTVYAGLVNLAVHKGSTVQAGTRLGTVGAEDGENILHFEVRLERQKLNPLQWVR